VRTRACKAATSNTLSTFLFSILFSRRARQGKLKSQSPSHTASGKASSKTSPPPPPDSPFPPPLMPPKSSLPSRWTVMRPSGKRSSTCGTSGQSQSPKRGPKRRASCTRVVFICDTRRGKIEYQHYCMYGRASSAIVDAVNACEVDTLAFKTR